MLGRRYWPACRICWFVVIIGFILESRSPTPAHRMLPYPTGKLEHSKKARIRVFNIAVHQFYSLLSIVEVVAVQCAPPSHRHPFRPPTVAQPHFSHAMEHQPYISIGVDWPPSVDSRATMGSVDAVLRHPLPSSTGVVWPAPRIIYCPGGIEHRRFVVGTGTNASIGADAARLASCQPAVQHVPVGWMIFSHRARDEFQSLLQ